MDEKQLIDRIIHSMDLIQADIDRLHNLGYAVLYAQVRGKDQEIVLKNGLKELAKALDRRVKEDSWPDVRKMNYSCTELRQYPKEERRRYLDKGEA